MSGSKLRFQTEPHSGSNDTGEQSGVGPMALDLCSVVFRSAKATQLLRSKRRRRCEQSRHFLEPDDNSSHIGRQPNVPSFFVPAS